MTGRFSTHGSTADLLIEQARNRILDPNVEREPNDDVLLVLGAVMGSIQDLGTRLPRNGNGRMAKARQVGIPAAGGMGVFAVVEQVVRMIGGF